MASTRSGSGTKHITPAEICEEMLNFLILYKSQLYSIAEAHDLTPVQLHTLRTISKGQNAMGKIAKVLHCDASNVTGIIDRLISLGLVTRHENESDRRIKSVQLTAKGSKTLEQIMKQLPERLGWDTISQSELNSMHLVLQKVSHLEKN